VTAQITATVVSANPPVPIKLENSSLTVATVSPSLQVSVQNPGTQRVCDGTNPNLAGVPSNTVLKTSDFIGTPANAVFTELIPSAFQKKEAFSPLEVVAIELFTATSLAASFDGSGGQDIVILSRPPGTRIWVPGQIVDGSVVAVLIDPRTASSVGAIDLYELFEHATYKITAADTARTERLRVPIYVARAPNQPPGTLFIGGGYGNDPQSTLAFQTFSSSTPDRNPFAVMSFAACINTVTFGPSLRAASRYL
jgi:hypothetical protein